jgi:hypothetical protein
MSAAPRHGVREADILHAITNAIDGRRLEDEFFFMGPDRAGNLLELVGRQAGGELVVFHAMPLREPFRKKYFS